MKNLPVASIAIGACLLVFSSGVAFAARNPSGTGQPGQTCQLLTGSPGQAAGSPGSVFNEPTATTAGGTGGAAYNSAGRGGLGAPSQYDVACFQQQSRPQVP
jgi:hypothetical protein